jgi:hypothetical protein
MFFGNLKPFAGYGEEQMHGIRGPVCTLQIKEKSTNPEGKEREEPKERT